MEGAALVLALNLLTRFSTLSNTETLHESIGILQPRVSIPHTSRPRIMCALGAALLLRYETLGADDDLDESIKLFRQVLYTKMLSQGNPQKHVSLIDFANALWRRYERDKRLDDITEAIHLLRERPYRCLSAALQCRHPPSPCQRTGFNVP